MRFFNFVDDSVEFFFLSFINRILQIFTQHRLVGRDFNYVHAINITEFLLLCQRRTCHAGFFLILIKEILESYRGKRFALPLYLHMLFCLDRLMQAVRITAPWHNTSSKFIYDDDFLILYHIILVTKHQIMSAKSQNHIMLNFEIFCICKILNMEEILNLLDAFCSKIYYFILFIDNKVSCLLLLYAHDRIYFAEFRQILAPDQLPCQNITSLIQTGRLSALP